jgi:putative peptidoglycan lipid II flippase
MSKGLARSAGVIGLATFSSRILGLVREVAVGWFFATGPAADAFAVATRIPGLLRDLFAEGAMSAAFVPTFTRYLQREGREAAWRLGSQVVNALLLITAVVVVLGILTAGPLVRLYAGSFEAEPGKLETTIILARLNMPFLMMIAVAAAFMGMLNALKRFFIPATSPATYNLVFVLCTVTLVPLLSRAGLEPVLALSVGMLAGGATQVAIQWPALRREGYRHSWTLDPQDAGLRQVLFLMGPGSLGVAAAQVNLLVATQLATSEAGAASALGYAFRLMYMPIGIFGVSVATAAIPDLARHASDSALDRMRSTLSSGLRLMLMLSVPATVGLIVLARPIVEVVFQHGVWETADTIRVAGALAFYAPGIVGYSVVKIASPSFYSLQDARTPMVASLVTIVANLVLNIWLNSFMGFRGLALGTAVAANINAGLLLWWLSNRIDGIDARRVLWSLAKISLASVAMAATAYYSEASLHEMLPGSGLGGAIRVALSISAAVATLAAAAWVLRIEEFRQAVARLLSVGRRFRG